MAKDNEVLVPALIVVRKIARLPNPCIELPYFITKRIKVGDEALFSYHETETEKVVKLIFKIQKNESEK
jgi:hypothetical protein